MTRSLLLLTLFSLCALAFGAEPSERDFTTRVRLVITADEAITAQVTSYVSRELRALGKEVQIVEKDPDWEMQVIAMQVLDKNKTVTGVALTAVVLQRSPLWQSLALVKNWTVKLSAEEKGKLEALLSDEQKQFLTVMTTTAYTTYTVASFKLRTAPPEGLQNICSAVVAEFDTKQLEPERKRWRALMEMFDRVQEK